MLQSLRRGEPASGREPGAARAWRALEASPGSRERQRRAGDRHRGRPSVPVPTLRRDHDGAAGRALRPAPLLGLGHRLGTLPVRTDGVLHRRDPGAGLHLAGRVRVESMVDAAPVGDGGERRSAAAAHRRLAAVARGHVAPSRGRAGSRVPVFAGAGDGSTRRASVRGSRARYMRAPHRARARSPPPPSRVVCRGPDERHQRPRVAPRISRRAARGVCCQ